MRERARLRGAGSKGMNKALSHAWLFSQSRLELILFATEKCNFRCTYCYEDFAHGAMSPAVRNAVRELLSRRAPTLAELRISWFGGEPLLARHVLIDIGDHASALAAAHGFAFSAGATTNAWFLDLPTAERLLEAGVNQYQITLDGPEEFHNQTRRLANGSVYGTFSQIWNNIVSLRESSLPVSVTIRCHVTANNASSWRFLADELGSICRDTRFSLHVHKVGRWGGPNDDTLEVASDREFSEVHALLTRSCRELPVGDICYAAIPSTLLVRADGSLGRCTVHLNDPRNRVGYLDSEGNVVTDHDRLRPWFRGWEGEKELLGCPVHGLPQEALPDREPETFGEGIALAADNESLLFPAHGVMIDDQART